MANTFEDEIYVSKPVIKWVSGEVMYHQFGYCAFKFLPQISPTDVSPLPKVAVTHPRRPPDPMKCR